MTRAVTEEMVEAFNSEIQIGGVLHDYTKEDVRAALEAALAIPTPREEPVAGDAVSREAAITAVDEALEQPWFSKPYLQGKLTGVLHALPAASQWRAMDSAPKDGTSFLAYRKMYAQYPEIIAVTHRYFGGPCINWPLQDCAPPTHWTPLPSAPISVEEGTES